MKSTLDDLIVINGVCLWSVASVSMVRSSQIVPNVLPNGQSAFEKHEIILVFDVALVEAPRRTRLLTRPWNTSTHGSNSSGSDR
jgi:hypothetical protein